MAATETATAPVPSLRMTEDVIREHQEKMARKREERAKRLPEAIRCLDAEYAAQAESEKPKYRYKISVTIQERDERLKRNVPITKEGEVDAHNEDDAWAIFCNKWKVGAGPKHCNRIIEKLTRKRNAQDN